MVSRKQSMDSINKETNSLNKICYNEVGIFCRLLFLEGRLEGERYDNGTSDVDGVSRIT